MEQRVRVIVRTVETIMPNGESVVRFKTFDIDNLALSNYLIDANQSYSNSSVVGAELIEVREVKP